MALPDPIVPDPQNQRNFDRLDQRITEAAGLLKAVSDVAVAGRAEDGLYLLRGTINTAGAGTINSGSGFTINRTGAGAVAVTFTTAYTAAPSVTLGTNADSVSFTSMPSTTGFAVLLRNETAGTLAAVDAQFTFIAVGR